MANTCSVLESGIEKMQFYSALTNVKEIQDFVMILGFWKIFIFHLAQCLHSLYHLVKKGHLWNWGSKQAASKKAKLPVKEKVAQLCLTLCDQMNCSPAGSSVHGILQTRILEWVAILAYRGSSHPRDQTQVSCIADGFFTSWATREAVGTLYKWNQTVFFCC